MDNGYSYDVYAKWVFEEEQKALERGDYNDWSLAEFFEKRLEEVTKRIKKVEKGT